METLHDVTTLRRISKLIVYLPVSTASSPALRAWSMSSFFHTAGVSGVESPVLSTYASTVCHIGLWNWCCYVLLIPTYIFLLEALCIFEVSNLLSSSQIYGHIGGYKIKNYWILSHLIALLALHQDSNQAYFALSVIIIEWRDPLMKLIYIPNKVHETSVIFQLVRQIMKPILYFKLISWNLCNIPTCAPNN